LKKNLFIIVMILILAGGGYALYSRYIAASLSPISNIPVAPVQKGPFDITLSCIGILDAAVKKNITSDISGKIVKIIPEGASVKEGDAVIWMDTSELDEQKEENEVEVKIAKTNLQQKLEAFAIAKIKNELTLKAERAKVEFQELKKEDARINYEKQKYLVSQNLAAKSAEDEARIAMLQAELSLKQAQINLKKLIEEQASDGKIKQNEVEKAKVELERQEYNLNDVLDKIDKAVLKADGPGNVSYSIIWKGGKMGKISEGDQVWRRATLMEIPDPTSMETLAPINEIDVGKIEVGKKAKIKVDSIPDENFSGGVGSKSVVPISDNPNFFHVSSGSSAPKGKEFEVRIKFDKVNERFRQGMTARTTIFIDRLENVLYVPQEAIIKEKDGDFLFVKTDGNYDKRPVKTGAANDNYIVIEGDFREGEMALLRDPTRKIERVGALEGPGQGTKPAIGPGK
jgi:HlyD family secretion protein